MNPWEPQRVDKDKLCFYSTVFRLQPGKGAPKAILTYHDGVKGHLLHVLPVIVKSQMPDSRVQVLDKAGLVEADGPRLPPGSFGLQKVPLLSCDQPAAIQQLDEVVLGMGTSRTV